MALLLSQTVTTVSMLCDAKSDGCGFGLGVSSRRIFSEVFYGKVGSFYNNHGDLYYYILLPKAYCNTIFGIVKRNLSRYNRNMQKSAPPYQKIIFVCTNSRDGGAICCSGGGSVAIREALKRYVKENGLQGKVRVSQSGCMDLCSQGPNIMIFPDGIWYKDVTLEDVPAIIQNHIALFKER